jgi:hypothetical protein
VFIGSTEHGRPLARTNSELGIVIRSAEIAHQVISLLDDISADGSYRLNSRGSQRNRIEWRAARPAPSTHLAHAIRKRRAGSALTAGFARAVRAG